MQLKLITRSCPLCGAPLALHPDSRSNISLLHCHTKGCGHTEQTPIDISMKLINAPQLPGF